MNHEFLYNHGFLYASIHVTYGAFELANIVDAVSFAFFLFVADDNFVCF